MQAICEQLRKIALEHDDLNVIYMTAVRETFPSREDPVICLQPHELHEIIIRIQIASPKKSKLTKFCKKVAPFVIQAREDARANIIYAAITAARTNECGAITAAQATECAEIPPAPAVEDFNEWLSANIVSVRNWIKKESDGDDSCVYDIDLYLAAHGRLDLLKQYDGRKSDHATGYAAENGHFETLQWLFSNGYKDWYSMRGAIKCGRLDMVQWLYHGVPRDTVTRGSVIQSGHLHILKWLLSQPGEVILTDLFVAAAHCNNVEIADYLHSISAPYDSQVSLHAARLGNLEITKWFVEHGYEIDDEALLCAFRERHIPVAEYLMNNCGPLDQTAIENAREAGFKIYLVPAVDK